MFLPLEKMYAPLIALLTRTTQRAVNSRSSSWLAASLVGSGAAKYRQMRGSSVIRGILRTGIFERFTMSKCRSRNASHSCRAAADS